MKPDAARAATNRMEWRRGFDALRALIADPERTDLAFEVIGAFSGRSFERSFERFRAHPDGRRLLLERPSLLAALSDRAALAALPEGSFGRAYLDFMQRGNLTAEGLVEADIEAASRRSRKEEVDPDQEFFGQRTRDMHDLWHVLTGYGMDEAGEAANLAFTHGQHPSPGIALILLAITLVGPKDVSLSWPRYLFRAWRRGRRAAMLSVVPYEQLLARPLAEVRDYLQIEPAQMAHPEGILVGNRNRQSNQWAVESLAR